MPQKAEWGIGLKASRLFPIVATVFYAASFFISSFPLCFGKKCVSLQSD